MCVIEALSRESSRNEVGMLRPHVHRPSDELDQTMNAPQLLSARYER
jgi:hypothetical protein